MSTQPGAWLPLMEFAMKKGVSLSTLRRHIKSKKIQYRLEDGRYLLWDPDGTSESAAIREQTRAVAFASSPTESDLLLNELRRAREEISELKTLVSLYEEQMLGNGKDSH